MSRPTPGLLRSRGFRHGVVELTYDLARIVIHGGDSTALARLRSFTQRWAAGTRKVGDHGDRSASGELVGPGRGRAVPSDLQRLIGSEVGRA